METSVIDDCYTLYVLDIGGQSMLIPVQALAYVTSLLLP